MINYILSPDIPDSIEEIAATLAEMDIKPDHLTYAEVKFLLDCAVQNESRVALMDLVDVCKFFRDRETTREIVRICSVVPIEDSLVDAQLRAAIMHEYSYRDQWVLPGELDILISYPYSVDVQEMACSVILFSQLETCYGFLNERLNIEVCPLILVYLQALCFDLTGKSTHWDSLLSFEKNDDLEVVRAVKECKQKFLFPN